MKKWPWIERHFNFDYPPAKFPDVLERLRGTPARVEELVAGLGPDVLTGTDGQGWTIQENIGHLLDCEALWQRRLEQFLAGAAELENPDMSGRRTREANHNAREIGELLAAFRTTRGRLVDQLEALSPDDWARTALHVRLNRPMRLVDSTLFACEHDDYHLARVRELVAESGLRRQGRGAQCSARRGRLRNCTSRRACCVMDWRVASDSTTGRSS